MSAIVLFDGVCNFCNSWVNFTINHDKRNFFQFAPLQSEKAIELLEKHGVDKAKTESVIVIENGKAYTYSTAALRIAKGLGGIWSLAYAFIVVPKFIRDGIYKWIAKNRYKWFGEKDQCMIPTPDIRARFLN
jgi:predicted DCC family thiol-disulfide oxidoreductase YuxK